MLTQVRRRVFAVLRRSGFFDRVLNSRWRRSRLVILCYHGVSVSDEHEWNGLYMSPAVFRGRLEILRKGDYYVLPLDEAYTRLRAGALPERAVAITFDEGSHGLYEAAFPLLTECGFPSTVYLSTYYCEFQRPVFDAACSYVLWRSGLPEANLEGLVAGGGPVRIDTPARRLAAVLRLRAAADERGLSGQAKDDLVSRLSDRVGVDYESIARRRLLGLMSPGEVHEAARQGSDIQLHTHRHRMPDYHDAFMREIEDNRASIARMLGPAPRDHFSYPGGVHKRTYVEWLRESGVVTAATTETGIASAEQEPLLLPRFVDTSTESAIDFEAWLTGAAEWLRRRFASSARTSQGTATRHGAAA
jgi:peptidoglycan/xylan/chitin deacetylase (PgdA/CDA1 family)